jgi:anti-sigma28 factor (negative regulator of flagellin synthesis)
MDVPEHDFHPMNRPFSEMESSSSHIPDEQQATDSTGAGKKLTLSLRVRCEMARRSAYASEAREAKIRELQDAIKNDTYHVTAEQIADKMLRSTLQDDLI